MSKHVVRSGESLSGIAGHFHVQLHDLIRANPQIRNPNLIHPGQHITIPERRGTGLADHVSNIESLRWPPRVSRFHLLEPGWQAQLRPQPVPPVPIPWPNPLPPYLSVALIGGPNSGQSYARLGELLVLDTGSQLSFGPPDQLAVEIYASIVIKTAAANLAAGRFDLFNQPTATVTLGLGLDPSTWGTKQSYVAMSLSVTALNVHLFRTAAGKDILELGLGQLAFGVQDGKPSAQVGIGAELHLLPFNEEVSIQASGAIVFAPGEGGGLDTHMGMFTIGMVRHY